MEEAGIAAVRTEAWGWIQESCILKKWCHICAAEANFSARTGYIQGHDCLFADKKKTVPLRDIVFPEKMSGKEPRHTAADNQHIRAHIPPEPRKGGRSPLPPCLVQDRNGSRKCCFSEISCKPVAEIFFLCYTAFCRIIRKKCAAGVKLTAGKGTETRGKTHTRIRQGNQRCDV